MNQLQFMLAHAPASTVLLLVIGLLGFVGMRNPQLTERFLLHPWSVARKGQYERLVTSGFLHADLMHLLFNLIAMYSVAMYVEAAAGTGRFLAIYFGSLVLSSLVPTLRRRDDEGYRALGASGAVSALFFAGMLYFPEAKVALLFFPVPMPWPVFAVLFLALSVYGARRKWDNVAHDVHIYGAVSGLALTLLLDPASISGLLRYLGA